MKKYSSLLISGLLMMQLAQPIIGVAAETNESTERDSEKIGKIFDSLHKLSEKELDRPLTVKTQDSETTATTESEKPSEEREIPSRKTNPEDSDFGKGLSSFLEDLGKASKDVQTDIEKVGESLKDLETAPLTSGSEAETSSSDDQSTASTDRLKRSRPIVVRYQDEAGKRIKLRTTLRGELGQKETIVPDEIKGYEFVSSDKELELTYGTERQYVTLTYKKVEGEEPEKPIKSGRPIRVRYVDSKGKRIKMSDTVEGDLNQAVTITTPEIEGYVFDKADKALEMTITDARQEITLTYKKVVDMKPIDPEAAGKAITVHYVDTLGNSIREDKVLTGENGKKVTVRTPSILGYRFVESDKDLAMTHTGEAQEITLTYRSILPWDKENQGEPITVHYVDQNGKEIRTEREITGKKNKAVKIRVPFILGYTYVEADKDLNMVLTDQAQSITLTYKEKHIGLGLGEKGTPITVHYVDENGKSIRDDRLIKGRVGRKVKIHQPVIIGYKFVKADNDGTMTIGKESQETTLVYKKKDIKAGKLPQIELPEFDFPKASLPKVEFPKPDKSKLDLSLPKGKSLDTSKLGKLPDFSKKNGTSSLAKGPSSSSNASSGSKGILPQTGEEAKPWIAGAGVVLVVAVLGVIGYRKKNK